MVASANCRQVNRVFGYYEEPTWECAAYIHTLDGVKTNDYKLVNVSVLCERCYNEIQGQYNVYSVLESSCALRYSTASKLSITTAMPQSTTTTTSTDTTTTSSFLPPAVSSQTPTSTSSSSILPTIILIVALLCAGLFAVYLYLQKSRRNKVFQAELVEMEDPTSSSSVAAADRRQPNEAADNSILSAEE
jgi:hypothetical protein